MHNNELKVYIYIYMYNAHPSYIYICTYIYIYIICLPLLPLYLLSISVQSIMDNLKRDYEQKIQKLELDLSPKDTTLLIEGNDKKKGGETCCVIS